ncbi:hypothetical protein A0J48_021070 [Sphaerospermopsis aphanizomenoides BCCUSP55]|uniref:hypothetical protein n=1 Tax=Sphaerospermopsis aphanizomenoides TaxID=459663 RepID=UPI00190472A1|nr:hypothetical protein [Sphaerospermopsis aphanizomenoides]MBK1989988.1 hypothetical protein [Sphaerospermopsis aphanizomenoides BCCUSP55]
MSDLELYKYLPKLPDAALQEFTEWCILEQSKAAGLEFKPDENRLKNLAPADYLKQLIDQFMKVKPDPIRAGLVAVIAGQQSDKHNLSGLAAIVDFVSLYVKYLIPKDGTDPEEATAILAKAGQHQYDQLTEIAKKHNVAL